MLSAKELTISSVFAPSDHALSVLRRGRIIGEEESPNSMIERVVRELVSVEARFGSDHDITHQFATELLTLLDTNRAVMSTPILTNAGRYPDRPLSACTIPPVSLRGDLSQIRSVVDTFHHHGMGTGFNLSETEDPVSVFYYLNHIAVEGAESGNEDRPVGNMGVLSVHHPRILEFISAKSGTHRDSKWIFNISVDISDDFMSALEHETTYELTDGRRLSARKVFDRIAESAYDCGDPGVVFLERMNRDNPTPALGQYVATAPCAEVGLAPGESCQFGYLNLAAFYDGQLDVESLAHASGVMVRALDNALELSIDRYAHPTNSAIMSAKRKIGVGICGLADLFVKMGLPYDSPDARRVALDIMALINYASKTYSHQLAKERGSFTAMLDRVGTTYNHSPGFIERKYGFLDTQYVRGVDWLQLGNIIRSTGLLRHSSTVALPPTGRSGLVIDASTGVEPIFSLVQPDGSIYQPLLDSLTNAGLISDDVISRIRETGSVQGIPEIPWEIRAVFRKASELTPEAHLAMAAVLQAGVDEAISKTINLPKDCIPADITLCYRQAYEVGLKGISVYRANSRSLQPRQL